MEKIFDPKKSVRAGIVANSGKKRARNGINVITWDIIERTNNLVYISE